MDIATHHEGETIHLGPALDVTLLSVAAGRVKLGFCFSAAISAPSVPQDHQGQPSPSSSPVESRSATLAVIDVQSDGDSASGGCGRSNDAARPSHNPVLAVQGRTSSYYLSRPGLPPMLIVSCGEKQRIRVNGAFDLVVLDVHASQAVRGLACPSPIHYTARRLAERLRAAQGLPLVPTLNAMQPQAAFST